jgi:hypothetical protein
METNNFTHSYDAINESRMPDGMYWATRSHAPRTRPTEHSFSTAMYHTETDSRLSNSSFPSSISPSLARLRTIVRETSTVSAVDNRSTLDRRYSTTLWGENRNTVMSSVISGHSQFNSSNKSKNKSRTLHIAHPSERTCTTLH